MSEGFRFLKVSSEAISPSITYNGVDPLMDALPLIDIPVRESFFFVPYPTTTTSSNFAVVGFTNLTWSTLGAAAFYFFDC